jgi:hypothetical protein
LEGKGYFFIFPSAGLEGWRHTPTGWLGRGTGLYQCDISITDAWGGVDVMTLSIVELARAREAITGLLDELGLDAYLFEVEPGDEQWELTVDCAVETDGAWESLTLPVAKEMLLASRDDASIHQRILTEWRGHFVACKLRE